MDPLAKAAISRAQSALSIAVGESGRELALDYGRTIIAHALSRGDQPAFAAERWGREHRVTQWLTRAAVSASGASDLEMENARAAWFASVLEEAVAGNLPLARRVAFNIPSLAPTANLQGYWVSEAAHIPLSKLTIDGVVLPARKTAAIVVASNEAMRDPRSELVLIADIRRAVAEALDAAFLSADAGTSDTPGGVLAGVSATASAGSVAADVAELIASFSGDLRSAALVTDSLTAAQAALTGGSAFEGLGVAGGQALGIRWIASRASPRNSGGGQLVLLDQSALALALEVVEISQSTAASLLMSNDPENDSPPVMVNLFQSGLVALKAVLHANWAFVRSGSVAAISGADYGAS